jgi:peptide/nickel transport system ATP-binding protein
VGDLLMEPLIVLGLHRNAQDRLQRVYKLLDQVGLPRESVNRYPHEFSGGQRQRIVIARALSVEPRFIICDESVAALDVSVQAQVLNLLNDLKKELGLTYLFISHDLSVVYHMSDRIMVMNKGKIEEMGTAQQVYHAPISEYTKKLLGSVMG